MKLRFPRDVRHFEVPIYQERVYVAKKWSQVEAIDRYMHNGDLHWAERKYSAGFVVEEIHDVTKIPLRLITILKRGDPEVVVHECGHLALNLCFRRGIKVDVDQQEPFCYLLDWLFTKVTAELKRG